MLRVSLNLLTASLIGALGGFAFWALSARLYSEEEIGRALAIISAATLVASFSKLGFDMGIIRFYPSAKNRAAVVSASYSLPLIAAVSLSVVSVVIFGGLLTLSGTNALKLESALIFVITTAALTALGIQYSYAIAARRTRYCLVQSSLLQVLRVALLAALASLSTLGLICSYGLGTAVAFLIVAVLLMRIGVQRDDTSRRPRIPAAKEMFRFSFASYIHAILQMSPILALPSLVLGLAGELESAYFGVAWVLGIVLITFPASSAFALFSEGANSPDRIRTLSREAAPIGLAILTVMATALVIAGKQILGVFGEIYAEESYGVLLWFIGAAYLYLCNELYFARARVRMQMVRIIVISLIVLTVIGAMSVILIPIHGSMGAVISWTVGQGAGLSAIAVLEGVERLPHIGRESQTP